MSYIGRVKRSHRLHALGVALIAVFALSALSASAASAAKFQATEYPAKVTANNKGQGNHVFTAGLIGNISCEVASFEGTKFLSGPVTELEVSPTYEKCQFLGLPTVVETHGCTYLFHEPTGGPTVFTGSVNVLCPEGKTITFAVASCKVEVGAQGPLSTVTYTNQATTPKTVKVEANVTGIKYTAIGTCNGLPGPHSDGHYVGTVISSAHNELLEPVGGFIG
jgi:hypothetical protein